MTEQALSIQNVSHRFGKFEALKDVSLTVPRGSFTALLGINGAGKTTLFSLITRLYDNTSGVIRVAGHDLRQTPGRALGRLGVVFQSRALDADLTVAQNLTYHAALHGIARKPALQRAAEVLALVGLSDRMDVRVSALSGGQQRRAEIARALIHRPEILLLDEATVGLDVKSRAEVVELTRSLTRQGVSALWATHIMDEIRPEDGLVILHRGQVLADDTAGQVAAAQGGDLTAAFLALTGASTGASA